MNKIPTVMKGVQLTDHGGLDKLVFRDDLTVVLLQTESDISLFVYSCVQRTEE